MDELNDLIKEMKHRLQRLEPTDAIQISDPPWSEQAFPSTVVPVSEVIENGTKIAFETILNKPDYKRPSYEAHWHSTTGRWSYVPNRIHYALHRLFINYDAGLSGWYDFEHNIGLSIPMFQNETDLDLYIVVFQTEITDVYTKGNQVVVVGNPKRNGVQAITIKTSAIHPINKEEALLVQLVTPTGDEMDYALTSYMPPDFWSKQKQN
ncbi:hypothetical protein [Psychrobacillus vulpis]|uniref:Uncharacterized protein n=1 Tax=Psychrobacillus vulpis TaxID=2325572 RepID=A0A544TQF5_9BACI|nr:hypothetical protein [Psychrobacillus vulpis]TQR19656.1 hypothetical protein FG384_12080 [Psychrobacillus vulpis]